MSRGIRRALLIALVAAPAIGLTQPTLADNGVNAHGDHVTAEPRADAFAPAVEAKAAPQIPTVTTDPFGVPYLAWVEVQDTLGQVRDSTRGPFAVALPALPGVSLVVPSRPLRFVAPAAPVLLATASPGGTDARYGIAYVAFLDDGQIIGTVAAPNALPSGYAFVWAGVAPGWHSVAARAVDVAGNSRTTDAISLLVASATIGPQVKLTTPATGTIVTPYDTVMLNAETTAGERPIQRVEFLAGATVIATVWAPPYTAMWPNPPAGNFMVTARVFDDFGIGVGSPASYLEVLAGRRPIEIVVTSPGPSAQFSTGAPVTLAATALAPDESIDRVDFVANGTPLGTGSLSAPEGAGQYRYQWANAAPGAYAVTAVATAPSGLTATSHPVNITIAADGPPTISLVAPANGALFASGQPIALSASATSYTAINRIDFYADDKQIGSVTATAGSTSFTAGLAWTGAPAGSHSLAATVFTSNGTSAMSAAVAVTVTGDTHPSIAMVAPLAGAAFRLGQAIDMTVQANSSNGISRVEFYGDGALLGSLPAVGAPSSLTSNFTATGLTAGPHALAAKVFATNGVSTTSAGVSVSVSDLSVTLTSPLSGQTYRLSDDIQLTANATATSSNVARVDFYIDGQVMGTVVAAPYIYTWRDASAGPHIVSTQAIDTTGVVAQSSPVTITVAATVAPTMTLDAGIDGSVVDDDSISIGGTVQAGANSVVSANGTLALLDTQGHFFANAVPLQSGTNIVTLNLNTLEGEPIVRTISLQSAGAAPFTVALDVSQGITPLNTALTITNRGGVPFQRIEIAYEDADAADQVVTSLTDDTIVLSVTYTPVGLHTIRVTVFDPDDKIIYLTRRKVLVLDPSDLANIALNTYNGMMAQLQAGNTTRALNAVTVGARAKYQEVFLSLAATLSQAARTAGMVRSVTVTDEYADIVVTRDKADGIYAYHVRLIRDGDGVWRVDGM